MKRRKVVAWHFYGTNGDPGLPSRGPAGERIFYGEEAWDRAVHWGTDRMLRPIIDDPHPGRILIRDVTPVQPRKVNQELWIGPDEDGQGGFTWAWRPLHIWGHA